jgi:hypothetical protein
LSPSPYTCHMSLHQQTSFSSPSCNS